MRRPTGADGVVLGRREGAPALEVEELELLVDRLGDALVQEREGAPHRGHVDRLVDPG